MRFGEPFVVRTQHKGLQKSAEGVGQWRSSEMDPVGIQPMPWAGPIRRAPECSRRATPLFCLYSAATGSGSGAGLAA